MKRLQPLLLAALMTCLTVPFVIIGETLLSGWQGTFILAVVPLTVLEGIWSKRIYQRERLSGGSLAWRLIAEGAVLMLILKLFSYLGYGFQILLDDIASWIRHPSTFMTLDFVLLTPLIIGVWLISQKLQTDLKRLSDPLEIGDSRQAARESIRGFILWGGFWLLSISGLTLGVAKDHFSLSRESTTLLETAVICYLGLALLLLAHMQYLRRHIQWHLEGLSVPNVITQRWVRWGFMLVIGIFLIAAVLPTAYTYGPERLIFRILDIFLYISQLIMTLLLFLFSPCMLLLGLLSGESGLPELPKAEPLEIPTPTTSEIPPWWIPLRQVLQYILIIVLLAIIFITYSKNRTLRVPKPGDILLFLRQKLSGIWLWLKGLIIGTHVSLKALRMTRRHPREVNQRHITKRWPRYQALTPRARVRRYYFSLLRRASEAGIQRTPQQTPQEYATGLSTKLPEQQDELVVLTEAFIHARYDAKEIHEEDVSLVRKAWYAIRNKLRGSRV